MPSLKSVFALFGVGDGTDRGSFQAYDWQEMYQMITLGGDAELELVRPQALRLLLQ